MTAFSQELFAELPIVGILRGFTNAQTEQIVQAAMRGGLRNIEITMNTQGAAEQIRNAVAAADGRVNIGAGTVLDASGLREAIKAGANFIVTPTVHVAVIEECVRQKT